MNIDINNLKRKPLLDPGTNINFNCFGLKIDAHPIVIMEYGKDLIFVNAQSAKYKDMTKKELENNELQKKLNDKELFLISPSNNFLLPENKKGLFYNDSLVDTTSLFIINKEDFANLFDIKNNRYLKYTRKIDVNTYTRLLEQINNNVINNNYTISKIEIENHKVKSNLIWAKNNLLKRNYSILPKSMKNQINIDKIGNFESSYNSKNILMDLLKTELNECYSISLDFDNKSEPYTYTAYGINDIINTMHLFGMDENACSDIDYKKLVETESFSDYEKDYYKQHPEEYNAKYKTYLETLKEAYFEYENKTKSKSSQNKINKCKDLDDDFELER